ncbi:MAG: DUF262 domain-containing protein [Solirubrobacteraceae bacterium]
MYALGGVPPEPLGPGSKEKRSALEALARFCGITESLPRRKPAAGLAIARHLGVEWDQDCYSGGGTITVLGINRLVDAAVERYVANAEAGTIPDFVARVMSAKTPNQAEYDENVTQSQERKVPEDLSEIEQNVAELVAQLASTPQVPDGVIPAPEPFGAETVRLGDGSWRDRLADVEGWLHLPGNVDADSGPEAFDASLANALGLDPEDQTVEGALLAKLVERLDKATALRDEFVIRMNETSEGSETLATATQAWVGAWEEFDEKEDDEGDAEGAPINASADTWPIADFVQHAEDDELNLSPSYQRADVWPTGDAQLLIESILRGIPLPSVIILQTADDRATNYEVVDGKQRLTSILRFIGAHPRATALVAEKAALWGEDGAQELFRADYPKFKKLWNMNEPEKLTSQVERRLYFPFPLRRPTRGPLGPNGSMAPLKGKYYSEIRDETVTVQGLPKKIKSIFESASAYKIPVITYVKVNPAQVHEVFSLYNKQGKHLNAEEIRNALYHKLDVMKALLVTAGDSEDVPAVAPFLLDVWDDLESTSRTLSNYGFDRAGYKRTKILSWTAASLLLDDEIQGRSTASHINALLKRVQDSKLDRLRDTDCVKEAMIMIDHGLDAHAVVDANGGWAPVFKNAQGKGKWQELQLVAGLIGMSAASLVLGDDLIDVADDVTAAILAVSGAWERPKSAQSKDQWEFISRVVKELLHVLSVDPTTAHEAIKQRFGQSGLAALLSA